MDFNMVLAITYVVVALLLGVLALHILFISVTELVKYVIEKIRK